MKKFRVWLNEAISRSAISKVNALILSYLKRKLGGKVFSMPGVEEFQNSGGHGFGVRYFYDKKKSVRFNWLNSSMNSSALASVDIWDGTSRDAKWHMDFETQTSLVKVLPTIIDFIKSPFGQGTFYAIPADNLNEDLLVGDNFLTEAKLTDFDGFDNVIKELSPNGSLSIATLNSKYGWRFMRIINHFRNTEPYSRLFQKQGKSVTFIGTKDDIKSLMDEKDKILMDIGGVKVNVTKGATQEIYRPNSQEKEIESKGIEKVAFEEQLRHLKVLMKLIIKGASNAMFVAGRGGTREDADCGR